MILFIPAVDIRKGKVVRLFKGRENRQKIYSEDPLNIIKYFERMKTIKFLHIVDLDAALEGKPQKSLLKLITRKTKIDLEWAGGVRTFSYIKEILSRGVKRVVLSSRVIEDIDFLKKVLKAFGVEKIAVSLDVIRGNVALRGWKKIEKLDCKKFIDVIIECKCKNIIITDISRDGTLQGVRTSFFKNILKDKKGDFYIAGGISSYKDLYKIKELKLPNIKGVIVGKAIYEGKIDPLKAQEILS